MTEKQLKLQRIVSARKSLMNKEWDRVVCNFDNKTFVEVSFFNSEADFRTQRYPSVNDAVEDQLRKLGRDLIRRVKKENMNELMEAIT